MPKSTTDLTDGLSAALTSGVSMLNFIFENTGAGATSSSETVTPRAKHRYSPVSMTTTRTLGVLLSDDGLDVEDLGSSNEPAPNFDNLREVYDGRAEALLQIAHKEARRLRR